MTDADLVPPAGAEGPRPVRPVQPVEAAETAQRVLDTIRIELAALLGDDVTVEAVRVDVDVFEGREPLVAGRWLDSMDLVQVIAALEARFDVDLAAILTGDEPATLRDIAGRIARSAP